MRKLAFCVVLLSAMAASAETFHVSAVRDWAIGDPAPISRAFKVYTVVGNMGGIRYTTQQTFSWGSQRFEVGKNYEVTKADAKAINITMQDKKGRGVKERLNVMGVEEIK